uniref:NADH-ubiquinone oxidoreductase chain 4L n=1 Tax=Vasticardium flavum TaxID=80826 RepID=A0A516IDJ1_9BIVA|nr:NADH dehydrogenase subunit 4L [Vasticardium flavum]
MVESLMVVMFLCSLCIIVGERQHIMMVMLALEMMAVSLYGMLCSMGVGAGMFCLVFLTFSVCEAVLGLGVLVGLVRGFGAAKVGGLFLLKF